MCDRGPTCNAACVNNLNEPVDMRYKNAKLEQATSQRAAYYREVSAIANFWWGEAEHGNAQLFQTHTGQTNKFHYWAYVKDDHPGGPGKEVK